MVKRLEIAAMNNENREAKQEEQKDIFKIEGHKFVVVPIYKGK